MSLPEVRHELPGWALLWASLEIVASPPTAAVDALVTAAVESVQRRLAGRSLAELEPCAAVRRRFRACGTDPTRYRPSSEALARRAIRDQLPRINPLVDVNNALSLRLLLPCCVMRPASLQPPLVLRAGGADETMASLRGPLPLAGKPVLADALGPFGTPITDSHRVAVDATERVALLVVHAPAELASDAIAADLGEICRDSGFLRVSAEAWSGRP